MRALIAALIGARRGGPALLAADWPVGDEAQAYAVQEGVAAQLGWGSPARHWKSGGASRAGPFSHAPLDPAGVASALSAALPWPLLGVEAEIALKLGRDVNPAQARAMQPQDAGAWLSEMCVAAELVASRCIEALAAPALLHMADHQSHGALLLGPWQPYRPLDWAQLPWHLSQPGLPDVERVGGHTLSDPAWLLPAWLQHLTRHGQTVPAGSVVTTGAWGGLHPLGSGPVSLRFEGLAALRFSLP